ncbi:MAG: stage V sporulation protein S [Chloroflexi bacterium]|jgi:stage V sporulation protein S|nr:stage V sporulation protein S [Chloroflexota bacterium]
MDILRVSSSSRSRALAGAIAGVVREQGRVELQAIGAAAVNQATKAIAIARGFLELDGFDMVMIPIFTKVDIADQEKTAVKLIVEQRQLS